MHDGVKEDIVRRGRRKEPKLECIAYLSTEGDAEKAEISENRQARYIREYAKAHNIDVVGIVRRHSFGMNYVNRQFRQMAGLILQNRVQGVIVANMAAVATTVEDAYRKVGMINEAGGVMVTVDEGRLGMNIIMEDHDDNR